MPNDFMTGVEFSHDLFKQHIKRGAFVIDATVGNGHDTVFLAKLVGEKGKVIGFDIQKKAIINTRKRLSEAGLIDRVELYQTGHENLELYLKEQPDGILFNLGYLPGSDKQIITQKETTLAAVKSGLRLLKKKGIMVLVIYTGHPGGKEEEQALLSYASELKQEEFNVLVYKFLNQDNEPAKVLAIKKR